MMSTGVLSGRLNLCLPESIVLLSGFQNVSFFDAVLRVCVAKVIEKSVVLLILKHFSEKDCRMLRNGSHLFRIILGGGIKCVILFCLV